MSLKATCKTQIDNEVDLVTTLEDMYGKRIKIVPEGVQVRGYAATQKPTIIVGLDGLYGTAGFYKNSESGKYELVYDNMDSRRLKDLIPVKSKTGIADKLSQTYSKIKVRNAIKQLRGSKIASEELDEEGNYKIRIRVPA